MYTLSVQNYKCIFPLLGQMKNNAEYSLWFFYKHLRTWICGIEFIGISQRSLIECSMQ